MRWLFLYYSFSYFYPIKSEPGRNLLLLQLQGMGKWCVILFIIFFHRLAFAQEIKTITEEYIQNDKSWRIEETDQYAASIYHGAYFLKNKTDDKQSTFISSFIINPNYDYTIEARFTQLSGKSKHGFGIIWGKYLESDHLYFMINSKKKYFIHGKVNGDDFLIKNWHNAGNKINKKGNTNVLTIEKKNKIIKYYLNGKKVYISDSYPIVGTEAGIVLNGDIDVRVDYFKVTTVTDTINLIESPINGNVLENLGPKVNSTYSERGPVISSDGKTLYITRTHPDNVNGLLTDDIWFSTLDQFGEWDELTHAGAPLNNSTNNFVISVTPDGNTLLVGNTYKRDGSPDRSGISLATKRDGKWQVPEKQTIRNYENIDPYGSFFLSPDGTKLIICAENDDSYGDLDLFVSFLNKRGKWSEPKNMGTSLNTFAPDFSPFLAADGKTLYFASYGHPGYGSSDIFVSKRLDDTWLNWSKPKNLGSEINTRGWDAFYVVSTTGDYAYMVSAKKDISYGSEDIFKIKTVEAAKPDPVVLVVGKVFNKKTNLPIDADIIFENLQSDNDEGIAYSTNDNGYKLVLPQGSTYGFRAVAEGYFSVSANIDLCNLEVFAEKEVNLYLAPIEKGQTFRLNNIFFDFDRASLQVESFPELNRLVSLLLEHPKMNIEIAGHTDNKGSDEYNLNLSQERANAVMNYIINQQIDASRISARGYGETKPISTNETEDGRQLNRRVEFEILKN